MERIKTKENRECSTAWPSRIISILTSMPLSIKLLLLVIIALIPRLIVFLQPQIITLDGMGYVKMAKLFSEEKYAGTPGGYFNLYPLMIFFCAKVYR